MLTRMCSQGRWASVIALVVLFAGRSQAESVPDCHLLAIGVDKHTNPARNLNGCAADGRNAVADFGQQAGKAFGKVTSKILLDGDATKQNIEREMNALEKAGKPQDLVVLFLSGHGGCSGQTWYFVPHDFNPAGGIHGITDHTILQFAQKLASQGKNVAIIVDACLSGQLRVNGRQDLDRFVEPGKGGILLMLASMPQQNSQALRTYSAFSWALHEALAGEADLNGDGRISLKETRRYVYHRVYELCLAANRPIHDSAIDYSPSLGDDLVLAHQPTLRIFRGQLTQADPMDTKRIKCHRKVYEVELVAGREYQFDLMSGNGRPGVHNRNYFDTFLRIEDAAGTELAANDDGGAGRNSRMTFKPTRNGKYRIVVTSCVDGVTGDFVLRLREPR